jgi:hypothetical protein
LRHVRHGVFIGEPLRGIFIREQRDEFVVIEAEQIQVEIF